MRNIEQFKTDCDLLLDQLEDIILQMPSKGDTAEFCQRTDLLNKLLQLRYSVNGTIQEDLDGESENE